MEKMLTSERVIAYIDGFNLYFGLKSKGWRRYYWLDIKRLSNSLLKPNQLLLKTKYFTSRVKESPEKQKRQNTFLEALGTLTEFEIFYGKYQMNPRQCRFCKKTDTVPNEKMTDVNIAVELLADAFTGSFDTALLVSADSDLVAPVKKVQKIFPDKKIVICFPPDRSSKELLSISPRWLIIGREKIAQSQFPDKIVKPDGFILKRPDRWK